MLDWLTVLELTAAALVVLGVLSVIAYFVNKARAKVSTRDSGKTRTVYQSRSTPEPRNPAPPAANATLATVTLMPPAADDVPPSSESLLPPLEPIPLVSDAPPPAVEAVPPANKVVSVRFPRFAKPRTIPAVRLKNAVRVKMTRPSKVKRRTRDRDTHGKRRILFAPVIKPKATRRPKRAMQIRRKKMTAPVTRSGKAVAHRSPRPVFTPA